MTSTNALGKSLLILVVACYLVAAIGEFLFARLTEAPYIRVTPELISAMRSNEILLGAMVTALVIAGGAVSSVPLEVSSALSLIAGVLVSVMNTLADARGLTEAVGNALGFLSTYGIGWLFVVIVAFGVFKVLEVRQRREGDGA